MGPIGWESGLLKRNVLMNPNPNNVEEGIPLQWVLLCKEIFRTFWGPKIVEGSLKPEGRIKPPVSQKLLGPNPLKGPKG